MECDRLMDEGNSQDDQCHLQQHQPQVHNKRERPQIRLSLWHDLTGGFKSVFHGEVKILLNDVTMKPEGEHSGPQWFVFINCS
ncbi:unnamed protein product [Anisakis simplex]|uniref:MATH domain-containing protein n=1 Tax=Anisakis simplex TaxID=6269 RepID=A0A0M3KKC7_ANISI|nr:unnamed protein product [Anisakis simplex]